jgi:serine/threonine-protein kinase
MHEEAVLVSLDHSNIVRLVDRGVSDGGLRYLVMEYVEGVSIDAFCDERRLSVRDRIRFLMRVMDAVAYAHRHLWHTLR